MSKRLQVLYEEQPCYDIVIEKDFTKLGEEAAPFVTNEMKVCVVTDTIVKSIYAEEVENIFKGLCAQVDVYAFPAGEENKTIESVEELYKFLVEKGYGRKDMLVALGGGVVGDMTGYAAATYLRGVEYIQIPTTLLAQTDSSIGGKTGVDLDGYKNMVGAFKMPKMVYMNLATLLTVDNRQYFAGFAEVMKHGLIKDSKFYVWLIENMYEICEKDLDVLEEMIYKSCSIKKAVVEKDPLEQGERAILNFGHTIGHAIEKAKNFELPHGECVALGAIAAAYISWKRDMISMDEYYEVRDMFVPFYLPISVDGIDPEEIVKLTKSDKKAQAGTVKFILLKRIGKAVIDNTVTDEEILAAVKEIYYDEEEMCRE